MSEIEQAIEARIIKLKQLKELMPEIVQLPANLAHRSYGRLRSDPLTAELGEQVLALSHADDAVKVAAKDHVARQIRRRVRVYVEQRGFRIQSRTDGLGYLYLLKGEAIIRPEAQQ